MMLAAPFMPMATQLPLPDTVELSVIEPELVVTFTLNALPLRVATTVAVSGACLGPISYFSRSALISFLRQAHCALVLMTVPSCMANGLGSFLFCAPSSGADVELQLAPVFSGETVPLPPVPVVPAVPETPAVPVVPPRPPVPVVPPRPAVPVVPAVPELPPAPAVAVVPAVPGLELPAVPGLELPAVPGLELPAVPGLELPAVPDPAVPGLLVPPVPVVPATPAPALPVVPAAPVVPPVPGSPLPVGPQAASDMLVSRESREATRSPVVLVMETLVITEDREPTMRWGDCPALFPVRGLMILPSGSSWA